MEENWRPHHELTPRKTMSMSQNGIKENGVKGTDVTNDIVVSPGQTSHEGQVTFDRHHETASQLQDSFCSSSSFLGFEDKIGLAKNIEITGAIGYSFSGFEDETSGFSGFETSGFSGFKHQAFQDLKIITCIRVFKKLIQIN